MRGNRARVPKLYDTARRLLKACCETIRFWASGEAKTDAPRNDSTARISQMEFSIAFGIEVSE